MISWRQGTVLGLRQQWAGAVELDVVVDGATIPALAYPQLVGAPQPGDRVLLNTTAVDLGLGTGGLALVVAVPDRLPPDRDGPGHVMKARYSPLQAMVLGVDEEDSPHHAVMNGAQTIEGMPVVISDLHSALPAVVAGIRADNSTARIAYVMTDGGALPIWFSHTVRDLGDLLCGTVTTGQSMGGDLESVTLHSGLLAARHVLRADVAIVTQGPGNLGTATPWGFSGVVAGEAVNATAVLHGRPVGALRLSGADPRERHRGVSHHSLTAYGMVALARAEIVVPTGLPAELAARVAQDVAPLRSRHDVVTVDTSGLDGELRDLPVVLSTMNRSLAEDRPYFLACAAAGRHAAGMLGPRRLNPTAR